MQVADLQINPYFGIWSAEQIPLDEILEFYKISDVQTLEDRPYAWTMTVSSLDGIISFNEKGRQGPEEIAMKHIPGSGSGSDWRLLNGGWMFADAVLGTGSILRAEPHTCFVPQFDDLLQSRTTILNKKRKYPLTVILTASGAVDVSHYIFSKPEWEALILTTSNGKESFLLHNKDRAIPSHISVEAVDSSDGKSVDLVQALKLLRTKYDVQFLDVTAGGTTIAELFEKNMIDEYRLTMAGQLCGPLNSEGKPRPTVFPVPPHIRYTPENNPVIHYLGVRIYGRHHLFIRGKVQYR